MIENKEWRVVFNDRAFVGIRRLGFNAEGSFMVDLWPCPPPEPRGGYFTMPPVSPLAWRRANGQSAKLGFYATEDAFVLLDEYGSPYVFKINQEAVEQLVLEAKENNIPACGNAALAQPTQVSASDGQS